MPCQVIARQPCPPIDLLPLAVAWLIDIPAFSSCLDIVPCFATANALK